MTWQVHVLQNNQDSNWSDRAGHQAQVEEAEEDQADSTEPGRRPKKPPKEPNEKLKHALSPTDMASVLRRVREAGVSASRPPQANPPGKGQQYVDATAALFETAEYKMASAIQGKKAQAIQPFEMSIVMDKATHKKHESQWMEAVKKYGVSTSKAVPPPADPQGFASTSTHAGVAGTIPAAGIPAPGHPSSSGWSPPSWDRLQVPPTQTEAMHTWAFRKEAARAFYAATTHLLSLRRNDDGLAVLDVDKQLRMLVVGEAGVGKSHLLTGIVWFAYQHGLADDLVLTSHQARPVARLHNPAVKGATTTRLFAVDSYKGHIPRGEDYQTVVQKNVGQLSMVIMDEFSLTSADHLSACSKQASRGLSGRAVPEAIFGGLHCILVGDPLQHTPVDGGELWYGQASSPAKAAVTYTMAPKFRSRLPNIIAGVAIFKQFDTVRTFARRVFNQTGEKYFTHHPYRAFPARLSLSTSR